MKPPKPPHSKTRRDPLFREQVHDPYSARRKLREPTKCSDCGAIYKDGRWQWAALDTLIAEPGVCEACMRIAEDSPAGHLTISGAFAKAHRTEIVNLARNEEEREKSEHALNRIMDITEADGSLVIRTTDIHLPRRIAHALERAYKGESHTHYDKEGYFVRITWTREA